MAYLYRTLPTGAVFFNGDPGIPDSKVIPGLINCIFSFTAVRFYEGIYLLMPK